MFSQGPDLLRSLKKSCLYSCNSFGAHPYCYIYSDQIKAGCVWQECRLLCMQVIQHQKQQWNMERNCLETPSHGVLWAHNRWPVHLEIPHSSCCCLFSPQESGTLHGLDLLCLLASSRVPTLFSLSGCLWVHPSSWERGLNESSMDELPAYMHPFIPNMNCASSPLPERKEARQTRQLCNYC